MRTPRVVAGIRSVVASVAAALVLLGGRRADAQQIPHIPVERYTLPNGLTVLLHEDHAVPLVAVETWYHVGSSDEQAGRTGFAHLFEHIMFMGSEHVPVGMFDKWLEAAGANNNGSTTQDRTNYYEWGPSNMLPLALWLDADRMGWLLPTMDQAKLDLQRDVVKNERRQSVDNVPYGRADETILAALFPVGHPYHHDVIGSMADLSAATLQDVQRFFRAYYVPNNATLAVVGDFNRDSAKTWIARYFDAIPRGAAAPPRPTVPSFTVARDTFLVLEDRVQIPRLYETWHTVKTFHPDDAALDVLAYILAGDKSSRLYTDLVYERQVAQDVSAYQGSMHLDGLFQIIVTPKPDQTPATMAELVNTEVQRVIDHGVTPRELARAKNTIRAQFLDRLASDLGVASQLSLYDYYAGSPEYVQQDAARYERVTAADVQRVARTYLGQHKVVLTVVPEGQRALMVGGAR